MWFAEWQDAYVVIAHVRFFTDGDSPSVPKTKWDVAIGTSRTVLKKAKGVTANSWISTGVAGGVVLIFVCAFGYALRSGTLSIDLILETIYSHEVTLCADLLLGVGDSLAFALCVIMVIAEEADLVQVLPAAIFFTVLSAVGSAYNAYYDIQQLRDIYQQKYHHVSHPTSRLIQKAKFQKGS